MKDIRTKLSETIPFLKSKTKIVPKVGIILGTGMDNLTSIIDIETSLGYEEVPHFPESSVQGHRGNLIFGHLAGAPVLTMQGRCHFYEGYDMKTITYPIRAMKALGIGTMIVSNAAGGLNPLFRAGDIMIIADHINLMGDNPLRGFNDDSLGPRFPDMSRAYTPNLRRLAEETALELGIRTVEGVLLALMGPTYETPAEYRFLRTIGADAVGMSTVPEVIVAVHSGMDVLGFSLITDMCLPDALEPASHEAVIAVAKSAEEKYSRLIEGIIKKL